jgi:hypothetical protein
LVRKRRCSFTINCVRAYSSTQNAFPTCVAIFTQPEPLAATDVTKHPRQVQTNLESSSFYRYVACYDLLRHSSVQILFVMRQEIMNFERVYRFLHTRKRNIRPGFFNTTCTAKGCSTLQATTQVSAQSSRQNIHLLIC